MPHATRSRLLSARGVLGALGLLGAAVPGAHAATLVNGSLEASVAPGVFIVTVPAGGTQYGWTALGANIEFVKSGYSSGGDTVAAAHDGDWMVDLNGTQGAAALQQSFATVAGQWYRIDYWVSGNAGPNGSTSAGTKSLNVLWNGAVVDSAVYQHLPGDRWSNLRWEGHDALVQASGSTSTLRFQSTSFTYSSAGPLLDDITLTAVPEPAALALWLAGLAGLGTVLQRRRAAAQVS